MRTGLTVLMDLTTTLYYSFKLFVDHEIQSKLT